MLLSVDQCEQPRKAGSQSEDKMGMCASTVPSFLVPAPISEHLQQEETNEPEEISQDDGKPQRQPPPGDDEILEMYKHHDHVKNRYTHHICTRGTQFDSWLQLLLLSAAASHFVCAFPAPARSLLVSGSGLLPKPDRRTCRPEKCHPSTAMATCRPGGAERTRRL